MSTQSKKRFKNFSKIIGIFLFILLMLTNIKIALLDDSEIVNSPISFLGIEFDLFEATAAETTTGDGTCGWFGSPSPNGGSVWCPPCSSDACNHRTGNRCCYWVSN